MLHPKRNPSHDTQLAQHVLKLCLNVYHNSQTSRVLSKWLNISSSFLMLRKIIMESPPNTGGFG